MSSYWFRTGQHGVPLSNLLLCLAALYMKLLVLWGVQSSFDHIIELISFRSLVVFGFCILSSLFYDRFLHVLACGCPPAKSVSTSHPVSPPLQAEARRQAAAHPRRPPAAVTVVVREARIRTCPAPLDPPRVAQAVAGAALARAEAAPSAASGGPGLTAAAARDLDRAAARCAGLRTARHIAAAPGHGRTAAAPAVSSAPTLGTSGLRSWQLPLRPSGRPAPCVRGPS